jgi:hypothetical protein
LAQPGPESILSLRAALEISFIALPGLLIIPTVIKVFGL